MSTDNATTKPDGGASASTAELGIPDGWDEQTLEGLLQFVRGEGKFSWLGPGITTHPEHEAEHQKAIHAAMLELERRGSVRRAPIDGQHSVTWMPNAKVRGGGAPTSTKTTTASPPSH